jgi:hypothetical protein
MASTAPFRRTVRVHPSRIERLSYLAARCEAPLFALSLSDARWGVVHDGAVNGRAPRLFVAARVSLQESRELHSPPYGAAAEARVALSGFDASRAFPHRITAGELLAWLEGAAVDSARVSLAGADVEAASLAAILRAAPGDQPDLHRSRAIVHAVTCVRLDLAQARGDEPLYLHLRAEGWVALLRAAPPVNAAPVFRSRLLGVRLGEELAPC